MHKNIINGSRRSSSDQNSEPQLSQQQITVTKTWESDIDTTTSITLTLYRIGTLVTAVVQRVGIDMQGEAEWICADAIPAGFRPISTHAETFPAMVNINSTPGRFEYDVDVLCLAEVYSNGSMILYRQPPPGSATWERPDDTSRVGWNTFSLAWTCAQ